MPSKNIVKTYIENGYYHVYNRGVEKREIFLDEQDCKMFLHYVKLYLSPIEELQKLQMTSLINRFNRFIPKNLSKEIELLSFALMPNHIHFQIKQITRDGIIKFMRRLMTSYVMYFNRKYKRVGPLFQDKYKAVLVENDNYLLQLSRYIHRNSFELTSKVNFSSYSSYPYYKHELYASWLKPQEILSYFSHIYPQLSYISFVENLTEENLSEDLTLEND